MRVTSEGLKVISKDGSSQAMPYLTGPSKLSSNITVVPTVNGQPTQGHVFVINPQQPPGSSNVPQQSGSHMIRPLTPVQTANPELLSQKRVLRHVGQITSNEDHNINGQVESNQERSSDGQQIGSATVVNSKEEETKETHAIMKEEGIEVRVQDEGGGDPPGHVIEQQHLLPGQVLQIQDENGQIIHMTAGEDGELVQVDPPEGGEDLPTVEQHGGEVHMQQVVGEGGDGVTTQVLIQENGQEETVEGQGNLYQTEDGLILIQNPDGSFQVQGHSDQQIPLDTVQALLAMEADGQVQGQS